MQTTKNNKETTKAENSVGGNKSTPTPGNPSDSLEKMKKIGGRKWFITVFPNEETTETTKTTIIEKIKEISISCKYWGYGIELCPTTKREHIHIYLEFKYVKKLYDLRIKFGEGDYQRAKGKLEQCAKYFSKGGNYETNIPLPKPVKVIEKLYRWQKYIVNLLDKDPDERKVYWIYDMKGCAGKTALCKYLLVKHPKDVLVIGGRMQDIGNGVKNHLEMHKDYPKMVIMNIPRDQKNISYKGIESVKDGLIVNTKFEVSTHVFNCPHMIVFSNHEPEREKLSIDRWKIINLAKVKK